MRGDFLGPVGLTLASPQSNKRNLQKLSKVLQSKGCNFQCSKVNILLIHWWFSRLLKSVLKKMSYVFRNLYWCWCWHHFKTIGHLWVPKTLTFKMRLGAQPFLWEWVLFAWEWKMISISKAEHLPLFWNRGPGEMGYGLFIWVWSVFREKELINFEKNEKTFRFILALSWNQHFSEFVVLDILSRQRRYR